MMQIKLLKELFHHLEVAEVLLGELKGIVQNPMDIDVDQDVPLWLKDMVKLKKGLDKIRDDFIKATGWDGVSMWELF